MSEPVFDKNRKCPKCGGSAYIKHEAHAGYFGVYGPPRSRVLRTCERCAYKWNELPLDHNADHEAATTKAWLERQREVEK